MSTMNKHFLSFALVLMAATALRAQGDLSKGNDYVIQGFYTPTIANAQKVDIRPVPIDTILPDRKVTYDMLPVKGDVPARVDSIEAAKLNIQQSLPRLYNGYVKGGFGLYTTPLGEIYYDQTRSRKNGYGVHLKHMSSNGGIDDVGPSDYSFNSAEGYYKAFMRTHEIGGKAVYDRRRVSYYGYTSNDSIENVIDNAPERTDTDLKQIYNDIGFTARIRSLYKDSTMLAHEVAMEVHQYSNLEQSRETNLRIFGDLSMEQSSETYGLGFVLDNNAYRGELGGDLGDVRQSGTLVGLTPYVTTAGEKYVVKVGAGLYVDAMAKTTFHFFPEAYLSYSLFDNVLVPYAGVTGERRRNSFRSLTRENPWLISAPNLVNTSLMYDIYGGLRGSMSSRMGFDVRISKARQKGMPLYVRQDNAPFGDRMTVVYDQVDVLDVSGSLHYHQSESVTFSGRLDLLSYDVKDQAEAWNLPPYRIGFEACYDIRDKLILRAEALFLGKRPALGAPVLDGDGNVTRFTTEDLNGFVDLYLGAEYRYTKRLSLFLDFSNLSASKYERWYKYPVQRGLVMGGATFSF